MLLTSTLFLNPLKAQVIVEGFEEAAWPTTNTSAQAAGTITINPYTTTNGSNIATSNTGAWIFSNAYFVTNNNGTLATTSTSGTPSSTTNTTVSSFKTYSVKSGTYALHLTSSNSSYIVTPIMGAGISSVTIWARGATTASNFAVYVASNTSLTTTAANLSSTATSATITPIGTVSTTTVANNWTTNGSSAYVANSTAGYSSYVYSLTAGSASLNQNFIRIQRNGSGEISIDDITVNYFNAPTVTASAASSISESGATLNGTVNANSNATTSSFDYGTSISYGTNTASSPSSITGTSNTGITLALTGLGSNTLYNFRAKGVNALGTTNGSNLTFTTLSNAPTVGTASSVTASGFTANWTAPSNTGSESITYSLDYSTDNTFSSGVTSITAISGTSQLVSALAAGTYYYRVKAVNAGGSSTYSAASSGISIAGASGSATVSTTASSSITSSSAILGGNIASNGGNAVSDYGVVYSTTSNPPTTADNIFQIGTSDISGAYSSTKTGLTPATTYYIAAYATNSNGTAYGTATSFSTPPTTPTVTTTALSSITLNSASSGGTVTSTGGASITAEGVCWNTVGSPTIADSKTSDGTSTPFTSNIAGLLPNTTYKIRAYATNSAGTAYGNEITLSTGSSSYYFVPTGSPNLASAAQWNSSADGSGTPLSTYNCCFNSNGVTYYINTSTTTTAPWTVSGTGSTIVVGNGTTASGVTLNIASGFAITTTSPVVMDINAGGIVNVLDATTQPTFGTLASTSEVHYQATFTLASSYTYGKLYFDGSAKTVTVSGNPIVNTLLNIGTGSTLTFSSGSTNYLIMNTGATAIVNGTIKITKQLGFVSFGVATPSSSFATLQFKSTEVAGTTLVLNSGCTIEFSRTNATSSQTIDSRTDYKNLTISDGSNAISKTIAGSITVTGTFTINQTTSGSSLTAGGNITVNGILALTAGTIDLSTYQLLGTITSVTGTTGTLKSSNTSSTPIPTGLTFASGTTVNYAGSGQTIVANSYANLDLTSASSITFPAGTINIAGAFTPGTITTAGGVGTMNFNGGSQTIPTFTYFNLTNSAASNAIVSSGTATVNGTYTINNGNLLTTGGTGVLVYGTGATLQNSGSTVALLAASLEWPSSNSPTNIILNSTLSFTSGANINRTIPAGGSFTLSGGSFSTTASGNSITFSNNSIINRNNTSGQFNIGTGTYTFGSSTTDVIYININASVTSSAELPTSSSLGKMALTIANSVTYTISGNKTNSVKNIDFKTNGIIDGTVANNYGVFVFGDITGTGSYTNGTVTLSTGSANVSGVSFNNLTLNNGSGIALTGNASVSGTLTLTAGNITLGTNNLTLSSSNVVAGTPSASKHIITNGTGYVQATYTTSSYTYPVGFDGSNYNPVTITNNAGTSQTYTVAAKSISPSLTNSLKAMWGIGGITASSDLTFPWSSSSDAVSTAPLLGTVYNYNGAAWTSVGGSTTGSYSTTLSAVTSSNASNYYTVAYPTATVTTATTTNVDYTSVTSGGNVTTDAGFTVTERGIVYSTSINPTVSNNKITDLSTGTGSFVSNISGLTAGTTYHVRAYAINSTATVYGADVSFTTLAVPTIALASNTISAGNIVVGSLANPIYSFSAAVTTNPAIINSISFTTTNSAAADITKYQLYYNTTNSFATATKIGTDITSSLGTGSHSFTGLSQSTAMGSSAYFWIAVDISGSATTSNTLSVSAAILTSDVIFASGIVSGSTAVGSVQTILAGTTSTDYFRSNVVTGNWSSIATWQSSTDNANWIIATAAPTSSSQGVSIQTGHTITIDAAAGSGSLTIAGNLIYNATTAVALTVVGNITVNSGATFKSAATGTIKTHSLSLNGNITNNGTIDFSTNTNTAAAVITFTGSTDQSISGTGTTTNLYSIVMTKNALSNIVEFNVSNFSVQGSSNYTTTTTDAFIPNNTGTGTIKFSGSNTFSGTLFASSYTIPSTLGLWLNNANFTVNAQPSGGQSTLAGSLNVSNGVFSTFSSFALSSGSSVTISGGIISTSGKLGVNSSTNIVTYNQSGGTVYVNTALKYTSSLAAFDIGTSTSSSFTMSGGNIVFSKANTGGIDFRGPATAASISITGGTVQFGTPAVATYGVAATTGSPVFTVQANVPSISINATGTPSAKLTAASIIKGSVSIGSGTTFDANSLSLSVTGDWTNSGGTFTSGTQTVTFNGTTDQTITNAAGAAYNSLTVNKASGKIVLNNNTSVSGVLTLTSGNISTNNSSILTLGTSATISGGSAASFVSCAMNHTIASTSSTAKIYPIGKASAYSPITLTITQSTASSTTYNAEAFLSAPTSHTMPCTIATVSGGRYYTLSSSASNISNGSIQLTYDANDATTIAVSDKTALSIAEYTTGASWTDLGPVAGGSANNAGIIVSSTAFAALGDFVIANKQTVASAATGTGSSVATSSITLNGTVTSTGNITATCLSSSFEYGTSTSYGTTVAGTLSGSASSAAITSLANNTLYHFRLNATNGAGTTNGTDATFTTLSNAPTVGSATAITTSGFTANWIAPANTGSETITYTVDVSTDNTFSTGVTTISGISSVSQAFTGLSNATQYYYRVAAVNGGGTSVYSSNAGFKTLATAPTTPATALTFSAYTASSISLNWTNGNGSNRVVVVKAGSAPSVPTNGITYTANAAYGSGDITASGSYVVYSGSGNSITVTGLSAASTYYFTVYENNGTGGAENYLVSSSLSGNQFTLETSPSTQASAINFTAIYGTSFVVNWTNGNGSNRIVLMKDGSAVNSNPVDGVSYTDNSVFSSGTQIGTGNYVVYNGSGSTDTITGLTVGHTYYVAIYEFNGSGGQENYLYTPATASRITSTSPSVLVTGSLSDFGSYTTGTTSTEQTYTVSATSLTANLVITAPTGFEVSTNSGSGFSSSLSLTPSSGTVSSTTIYVHFVPSSNGVISGNITNASTGATTNNVAVSGTGVSSEPTNPATNITFSNVTTSAITVGWTNGNGAKRIVVASTSPISDMPVDNINYTANAAMGSGDAIGSTYVVYNGSGNSVSVTGLTTGTVYYFAVVEYNDNGSGGFSNYNITSPAIGYRSTLIAEPTVQASAVNFTNVGGNSATINWTSGNGTRHIVIVRQGTAIATAPSDGTTYPSPSTTYGSGTTIGSGYVAYLCTCNSFTLTGLTANTTYYIAVYDLNGNYGSENYLTSNPALGNFTTITAEPTVQATSVNFTSVTASSFNVNFTVGNGANRIVLVKATSAVDSDPVDVTSYTANATFSSGSQIGTGNYVVYNSNSNTVAVSGLTSGVTYYVAVFENNGSGTNINYLLSPATGSQTTLSVPIVTTASISSITSNSANAGGNVTGDGGVAITERGIVISSSVNPTVTDTKVIDGATTIGSFTSSLTGLTSGVTYHVRAYAINSQGAGYGSDSSFTTLAIPTVSTTAITAVTTTSASSGGTVTSNGGSAVTAAGICWSTSSNPTVADSHTSDGTATPFTSSLTGLTINTQYHVRAYATNAIGTAYGNDISFYTLANKYYFVAGGSPNLADLTQWFGNANGTGANPPNFTTAGITYQINSNATTTAAWSVSGTGSAIVLGDPAVTAATLTIASSYPINTTGGLVLNIAAAASGSNKLVLQNTTLPTLGTANAASTIEYQASVTMVSPTGGFGHLTVSAGTTTINATTTVNGDLSVTNTGILSFDNSVASRVLTVAGNLTLSGSGGFTNTGSSNSFELKLTGSTKTISNTATANLFSRTNINFNAGASYSLASNFDFSNTSSSRSIFGTGTLNVSSYTLSMGAASLAVSNINTNILSNINTTSISATPITSGITWNGSVEYKSTSSSTAQTIVTGAYHYLIINNSNKSSVTAANSAITVDSLSIKGAFGLTAGTSATLGYNTNGTFIMNATSSIALTSTSPEWPATNSPTNISVLSSTLSFTAASSMSRDVNGSFTINGGSFTLNSSNTLRFAGGSSINKLTNNNINTSSGTYVFGISITDAVALNIGSATATPVVINSSSELSAAPNGLVNLNIYNGFTYYEISTSPLSVSRSVNNLTLNGTFGDTSINARILNVKGNISGTGTYAGTSLSKIIMTGNAGIASISGATINNIELNNSNGFSLAGNPTINGSLTFTAGILATGSNKVIVSSTGTVSQTGGWVYGNLQKNIAAGSAISKTFEVGDAAANYTPVSLTFASVTTGGDLIATTNNSATSQTNYAIFGLSKSKYINRFWTLTSLNTLAFTNYAATYNFVSTDIIGSANTAALRGGVYSNSWTYPTMGALSSNSSSASGITTLGDAMLAECSAPATFNVTANGSATTASYCSGGAGVNITLNGSTTDVNYQLVLNGNSNIGSPAPGTGSAISFGNLTTAGTYSVVATNAATVCSASMYNSPVVSITINTWTGVTSSNWNTASNWCANAVPSSGESVSIPSGTPHDPAFAGDVTVTNISGNDTINLNGHTLTVSGTVSGTSVFTGSSTSSLVFSSGASGTIKFDTSSKGSTNALNNLTINTGSGTITLGSAINIYGNLNVASGTFNAADSNVILQSTSTGTASVDSVKGTITGATNFTILRYHLNKRTWALLTAPLTTNGTSATGDIKNNWQKYTYITGPVTTGGLDANSGISGSTNYSMNTWSGNAGWTAVTNTTGANTLFGGTGGTTADNKAFYIFLRGDRSVNPTQGTSVSTAVTVQANGALQTGTKNFALPTASGTKYALVGNPYAAPIDLNKFAADNTSLAVSGTTTIYYWDAKNSGSGGYTTATYSSGAGWNYSGQNGANTTPRYIQSGQAFFVSTNGQNNAVFKESQKAVSLSNNNIFGTSTVGKLRVNLTNGSTYIDGVLGLYDNSYTTALVTPGEDAGKFFGNEEGVAISRTGKYLSIESRPEISGNDTMYLYMNKMIAGNTYKFDISGQDLPATVSGYLVDKYLNKQTALNLTQSNAISFNIDTAAASKSATRFMIVFNTKAPLYASEIKVKATVKAKAAVIDWTVSAEKDVDHYTVESSRNGKEFSAINNAQANNRANSAYSYTDNHAANGDNYYRIKAISKDGSVQYSNIAKVTIGDRREGISIYPNPVVGKTMNVQLSNVAEGNYEVAMYNANGQQVMAQTLQHAGGSITSTFNLPANLASGIYQLKIGKFVETVIVK